MPFEQADALKQAGYSDGDFVPLTSRSTVNKLSTSSGDFQNSTSFLFNIVKWSNIAPAGVQLAGEFTFRSGGTVDANMDVRLRNLGQSETIAGPFTVSSGDTFTDFGVGPTTYDPTTFDQADMLALEVRADGTNTVEARRPSYTIGVIL